MIIVVATIATLLLAYLVYERCIAKGRRRAIEGSRRSGRSTVEPRTPAKDVDYKEQKKRMRKTMDRKKLQSTRGSAMATGRQVGLIEGEGGLYKTRGISRPSIHLGATEHRRRSLALMGEGGPQREEKHRDQQPEDKGDRKTSWKVDPRTSTSWKPINRINSTEVLEVLTADTDKNKDSHHRVSLNGGAHGDFNQRQYAHNLAKHGFQMSSLKKFLDLSAREARMDGAAPVFAYRDNLDLFSRYEKQAAEITLIRKLGAGAFADVHLCMFRGRQCAVKVIRQNGGFVGEFYRDVSCL